MPIANKPSFSLKEGDDGTFMEINDTEKRRIKIDLEKKTIPGFKVG